MRNAPKDNGDGKVIVKITLMPTFVRQIEVSEKELSRFYDAMEWYTDMESMGDPRTAMGWDDVVDSEYDVEILRPRVQSRNVRGKSPMTRKPGRR